MKTTKALLYALITLTSLSAKAQLQEVNWADLTAETFQKAKSENKIILLDLEANWCHWCHVMHDSTYSNPEVMAYINQNFIAVKADQDGHPELSNRYKDYGWPATIFINAQGEDVVKRAGYISANNFLRLLKAIVSDPSPETKAQKAELDLNANTNEATLLNRMQNEHLHTLDLERGGYAQAQKYVAWEAFEYALFSGKSTDEKTWLLKSIAGAKQLQDPAWGGIYQYSTHNDWQHLHFEKLLSIQARYLKIFSLGYLYFNDEEALSAAQNIVDYSNRFLLQPNGLYANAQDADLIKGKHAEDYFALSDKKRTELGIPKVDTNTYTQNNAEFVLALLQFNNINSLAAIKNRIEIIAQKILQRKAKNGLYYHAHKKRDLWSLKDQIAVAEMLIGLIKNQENNLVYKAALNNLMISIKAEFISPKGFAISFVGNNGLTPTPLILENTKLARVFNWYAVYSKNQTYKNTAKGLYQYLVNPALSKVYYAETELLLLHKELNTDAYELVFLEGEPNNETYLTAKTMAPFYSLINRYSSQNLPQAKKEMFPPDLSNVLFICTSSFCSSPLKSKAQVVTFFNRKN